MANFIKLKLPGLDERDIPQTKRQQVNTTAVISTTAVNTIASNINSTAVTTITAMPKGMKVKFSRNFEGEEELNQSTPSVCRLSDGCSSNILGTVWCVKLKLTGVVVRDVVLTKRKYLHPNATAFTHTIAIITTSITTTSTKAYATSNNSTATSVIKTEDIKAKNFGYTETVWN